MTVGPFANFIRPFTINGNHTLGFVNVNGLLGFEIGDLQTGQKLYRVAVPGFTPGTGPVRHGCPSHGIALSPDEKEIWVDDGYNKYVHVFDATSLPPKLVQSIKTTDLPGWVTFSIDGRRAYISDGEVVDTVTRQVVHVLKDETGRSVQSEKLLEVIVDANGKVIRAGNQFGIGQVIGPAGTGIRQEVEYLTHTNTSGVPYAVTSDAAASSGGWGELSSNAAGQYVDYTVGGIVPGTTYDITVGYKTGPSGGQCVLTTKGGQHGGTLDQYAATGAFTSASFGTFHPTLPGSTRLFRFAVTGKNASSSGYALGFDYITITPHQ